MDLKIKDVAELLNVSETTIRRWLVDGKIPAYKLNHQYRFSRDEIENWMMSCKLVHPKGEQQIYPLPEDGEERSVGMQQFSLFRALHKGEVLSDIEAKDKEEIIRKTMALRAPKMGLDADVLAELFIDRENLMSTALNSGVAIPHARDFVLPSATDSITLVFPTVPIAFGALDGLPVHTLFFLFSSSDKRHLHLLAKIAHLCSQEDTLEFLKTRPTKEVLLTWIKTREAQISL